jgi:hypothetical protein
MVALGTICPEQVEKVQAAVAGATRIKTVETLAEELDLTEEELRAAPFEVRHKIIESLDIRGEVAPKDDGWVLRVKRYKHLKEFGLENRVASNLDFCAKPILLLSVAID